MMCVAANEVIVSHLAVPLVPRPPPTVTKHFVINSSLVYTGGNKKALKQTRGLYRSWRFLEFTTWNF